MLHVNGNGHVMWYVDGDDDGSGVGGHVYVMWCDILMAMVMDMWYVVTC